MLFPKRDFFFAFNYTHKVCVESGPSYLLRYFNTKSKFKPLSPFKKEKLVLFCFFEIIK